MNFGFLWIRCYSRSTFYATKSRCGTVSYASIFLMNIGFGMSVCVYCTYAYGLHRRICTWCDVMWCHMMWCNMMWCDVMWCDVMRCGMIILDCRTHKMVVVLARNASAFLRMAFVTSCHAHREGVSNEYYVIFIARRRSRRSLSSSLIRKSMRSFYVRMKTTF